MNDLNLNLIGWMDKLDLKKDSQTTRVFDPIRKKFVAFKPEEMVRQLFILFLLENCAVPKGRIAVERSIQLDKLSKRFDLLIFDKEGKPMMIVECKSAKVKIDQKVLDQAGAYNWVIRAPYLLVTNGINAYGYELDFSSKDFTPLLKFPKL